MYTFLQKFELRIFGIGIIVSFLFVFSFYAYTYRALFNEYNRYLLNTVKVASLQFDPEELLSIQKTQDISSDVFLRNIKKLQAIEKHNKEIFSIYILAKTERENFLEFIIDADYEEGVHDIKNGLAEKENTVLPGGIYDASDVPIMIQGFDFPVVEKKPYADKWGLTRSAYAPIVDNTGKSIGVFGIDIDETTYRSHVSVTRSFSLGVFIFLFFMIAYISYLLKQEKNLLIKNTLAQKENQRLAELHEIKNNIISVASHELRTPMTVIKTYTSLLQGLHKKSDSKDQTHFLEKISYNTTHMIELINDMLDLSKLESGSLHVCIECIHIDALLKEIKKNFLPLFKEKNIQLIYKSPKNQLPLVLADKGLLKRLMDNLLSNALKFTDTNGSVSINILTQTDLDTICIEVKDTGVGIPKGKIPIIFEKFSQVDNALSRNYKGTGLGLAIVKNIVEKIGGAIICESEEGKGTSFIVTLKCAYQ